LEVHAVNDSERRERKTSLTSKIIDPARTGPIWKVRRREPSRYATYPFFLRDTPYDRPDWSNGPVVIARPRWSTAVARTTGVGHHRGPRELATVPTASSVQPAGQPATLGPETTRTDSVVVGGDCAMSISKYNRRAFEVFIFRSAVRVCRWPVVVMPPPLAIFHDRRWDETFSFSDFAIVLSPGNSLRKFVLFSNFPKPGEFESLLRVIITLLLPAILQPLFGWFHVCSVTITKRINGIRKSSASNVIRREYFGNKNRAVSRVWGIGWSDVVMHVSNVVSTRSKSAYLPRWRETHCRRNVPVVRSSPPPPLPQTSS